MLYIVPTPIGNLRDITLRALDVLKGADVIVCEDTRQTQKLLNHYGILGTSHCEPKGRSNPEIASSSCLGGTPRNDMNRVRLMSFHEHSGSGRLAQIVKELEQDKSVAVVTDGGTPSISDPGFEIVREALRGNFRVEVLPGPTAFATALVASGLACDSFSFFGFLPQKSAAQRKFLTELEDREETLIFYESPFRLVKVLSIMNEVFGDREAAVARELTKKFEEVSRGRISALVAKFSAKKVLGEIAIVIAGKGRKEVFVN